MKWKFGLIASACLAATTASANDQTSNVEIYGNVDVGLTFISNTGGKSQWVMSSGIGRPSRLGFRGSESLGGGLRAIFVLENGINVDTGTQADASSFFNRESAVGLVSPTFGTIKLGRMPDFFFADIGVIDSTPLVQGGMTSGIISISRPFGTPGAAPAVGLHYPGARYNNSIKWLKDIGPVRVGLMYGLGSENDHDKMHAAMIRYENGGLAIGASYTKDNFTTALNARETAAVKAQYRTARTIYFANYGFGKDTRTKAKVQPLEIGFQYAATPAWRVGAGIGYTQAWNDAGQKATLTQPFAGVKYLLSKRTELYAMAAYSHTSNRNVVPATVGAPGGAAAPSTSNGMTAVRFGILHYF